MSATYPYYSRYTALLAQRDAGVLCVVAVAAILLLMLFESRALWPRFFVPLRNLLIGAYWLALIASLGAALLFR